MAQPLYAAAMYSYSKEVTLVPSGRGPRPGYRQQQRLNQVRLDGDQRSGPAGRRFPQRTLVIGEGQGLYSSRRRGQVLAGDSHHLPRLNGPRGAKDERVAEGVSAGRATAADGGAGHWATRAATLEPATAVAHLQERELSP